MPLFLSLVISLLFAVLSAHFAMKRGRDPRIWFVLGFFFGIIGLIVLLILPSAVEEKEEKIESKPTPVGPENQKEWYYLNPEHVQVGPIPEKSLKELLQKKELSSETYVWTEGMQDWKKLENTDLQ